MSLRWLVSRRHSRRIEPWLMSKAEPWILPLSLLLLLLSSCRTVIDSAVPGAHTVAVKNVYNEYMLIGDEYIKVENYDKAIEYYKKALGEKSIYWSAYYKLARAYALSGKWQEAGEAYTRLLERDGENTELLRSAAYVLAMSGDIDGAMDIYNRLLDKRENDEETIANVAAVMLAAGQKGTAELYFEMLKEKFPESGMIDKLGAALEEEKKKDEVEEEDWESYEKSL